MRTTAPSTRVPQMLSIRQVAERYGVCTKTVSRWIKSQGLHSHKIGRTIRIAEEDAMTFMTARRS
jgi:excisionase family DNA binding protein